MKLEFGDYKFSEDTDHDGKGNNDPRFFDFFRAGPSGSGCGTQSGDGLGCGSTEGGNRLGHGYDYGISGRGEGNGIVVEGSACKYGGLGDGIGIRPFMFSGLDVGTGSSTGRGDKDGHGRY